HQHGAELGFELVEHGAHLGFAVGQRFVEDLLAGGGESVAVVGALAHVQAEEHADVVGVGHGGLPGCGGASGLGRGVVLAHPRYAGLPSLGGCALRSAGRWPDLSSAALTAPVGPGDTTPQVMSSTGGNSHAGP